MFLLIDELLLLLIVRGTIANMLITSCKDDVCRVWVETVLPEDGLQQEVQLLDSDSSMAAQMYHTQRHKKHFMHRLQQIRFVSPTNRVNGQGFTPVRTFNIFFFIKLFV